MEALTRILEAEGPVAADEMLPLVYEELRRIAAGKMARQPPGETLQATALVHEAYIKIIGSNKRRWENRSHFFSAIAEAVLPSSSVETIGYPRLEHHSSFHHLSE